MHRTRSGGYISAKLDASFGRQNDNASPSARPPPPEGRWPGLVPSGEFSSKMGCKAASVRAPVDRSTGTPALQSRLRPTLRQVSTASAPRAFAVTTLRSAPPVRGETGRAHRGDLPDGLSEIFCDGAGQVFADLPVGRFSVVVCEAGRCFAARLCCICSSRDSPPLAPTGPTAPV